MNRFIDTPAILRELGLAARPPARILAAAERVLGIHRLEEICVRAGVTRSNTDVPAQIRAVFAGAGVAYEVSDDNGQAPLPPGPLIFYCNHPYGIADALIALEFALRRRPDTKVLANMVLGAFDVNADHIIWIDPFSGPADSAVNQRGLRGALKHLRGGGALLMFPAGECSHLDLRLRRVTDSPWTQHLPRFLSAARATTVPIHFAGRNSWYFQMLGVLHPMLRTLLLLHEFVGLRGQRIQVRVGATQPYDAQADGSDTETRTRDLRARVYALASVKSSSPPR